MSPSDPTRFFKNTISSLFSFYDYLNAFKKSEKTDEAILRFCVANRRMDGRRDSHRQIHWTLPLVWVSKNQTLKTNFYAVSRHALNCTFLLAMIKFVSNLVKLMFGWDILIFPIQPPFLSAIFWTWYNICFLSSIWVLFVTPSHYHSGAFSKYSTLKIKWTNFKFLWNPFKKARKPPNKCKIFWALYIYTCIV